jgi:hypothetical protein
MNAEDCPRLGEGVGLPGLFFAGDFGLGLGCGESDGAGACTTERGGPGNASWTRRAGVAHNSKTATASIPNALPLTGQESNSRPRHPASNPKASRVAGTMGERAIIA